MTNKEMIEPWRQYGVRLEKEDTVDGVTHLYISVPKMSDFFDDNGSEAMMKKSCAGFQNI